MQARRVGQVDVVVQGVEVAEGPLAPIDEGVAVGEDLAGVGHRIEHGRRRARLAHVDPDRTADLVGRVGAGGVGGLTAGGALRSVGQDRHAGALAVEGHAVVAAGEGPRLPGAHLAQGEQRAPVGAAVREGPRAAFRIAEEHDRVAEQRDGDGLVVAQLRRHQRRVPVLAQAQEGDAVLVALHVVPGDLREGRRLARRSVGGAHPAQQGPVLRAERLGPCHVGARPGDPLQHRATDLGGPMPECRTHPRAGRQRRMRRPVPVRGSVHGRTRG